MLCTAHPAPSAARNSVYRTHPILPPHCAIRVAAAAAPVIWPCTRLHAPAPHTNQPSSDGARQHVRLRALPRPFMLTRVAVHRLHPAPAPREAASDSFVRKSKHAAEDGGGIKTDADAALKRAGQKGNPLRNVLYGSAAADAAVLSAESSATAVGAVEPSSTPLPGAVQDFGASNAAPRAIPCTDTPQNNVDESSSMHTQTPPATARDGVNAPNSASPPRCRPAHFNASGLSDEQSQALEDAILYLQLTVQGFSFSIGAHSRYCRPALRVLMSFWYISALAIIISVYSGLPWLERYEDDKGTALHPWWAKYLDSSTLASVEAACVAFLFCDLFLNIFAQGVRPFYRNHPLANVSYTLIVLWFLVDLCSSVYSPGVRLWSKGLRPVALVRSVPKLEQVVSVFASTLLKSLKLTFFAATFLLTTGCLSVIVTRYACEKRSAAQYCENLRKNWGSLDVSMLSSFVIITSSGYARLFEDFLSIVFSSSSGDFSGALNFSMLLLMCAIVFGGALGLTALYTASVFDSFKKARSQQYLMQLGLEHRYLVESYMAACRAFDADEVDGLSEEHITLIIEAVMPRFRGHHAMLELLFRLIDVDQGGSVNVIEYCRLCGIIMLNFEIVHEGAPEDSQSLAPGSSVPKGSLERRRGVLGAAHLGLMHHVLNPKVAITTLRHKVHHAWAEMMKAYQVLQLATIFLRRFCASKFARFSVFLLLWSHLVLTVINAQLPPFQQDMEAELQNLSNITVSYERRWQLNYVFDLFIWSTSVYLALVLWAQYAFSIAKINVAMIFIPIELLFIFLGFVNAVADNFCVDCIWYARIFRSVRVPIIALSLEPFVPLMKAISELLSTLAVYIAFFYIVLNLFANLGHVAFRDLGFVHRQVPALSFSTLQQTLTIAIELSTADDWDEIRYDLYRLSKERAYDVFFVFFYIVFNLCTTNVVTSLAIECFEYLHERETKDDVSRAGLQQQQAFDMAMHMQSDSAYEMMLAPNSSREIWTGRHENHEFVEKARSSFLFSKENMCCLCNKPTTSTLAMECSQCSIVVHFDCWQRIETQNAGSLSANDLQRFGRLSFLNSSAMPACTSKLHSDALQLHFSVHVKKVVNLLDVLILGPQVCTVLDVR